MAIRKDCKKYYRPEQFASYDIAPLIGNSCRVTNQTRSLQRVVINYYSEYLSGAHLKAMVPLLEVTSSHLETQLHNAESEYTKSAASVEHMRYLHRGMNNLVDDLVHAATAFSERPDFKTMHKKTEAATIEEKQALGDESSVGNDGEGGE